VTKQRSIQGIFGSAEAEPVPRTVTVDDFHLLIADGALRQISYRGVEIVRRLDCPIRDQNWGTHTPAGVEERLDDTDGWLDYRRTFSVGDGQLSGILAFTIEPGGPLTARIDLTAIEDFTTSRAGFTLLHPITDVAGHTLSVTHADGTEETTAFPKMVAPGQPVFDIRRLRHKVGNVDVSIEFSGEIFEMEDQRNWTDASYKTYCRPLRLAIPYVIKAGETVSQEIRITASAIAGTAKPAPSPPPEPVRFARPGDARVSPDILLAAAAGWVTEPENGANDIAGVNGIVARLEGHETGQEEWIRFLAQHGCGPETYCDLEIIVPNGADPAQHLRLVAVNISKQGIKPRHVFSLPADYLRSYQPNGDWPQGLTPEDCARAAEKAFPDATIGVGMMSNFTEVNRRRPAKDIGSYLTFGTTAIVHAADDRSVLETLEAFSHIFATARSFNGARDIRLGLVAIGMRTNPYGAGVAPNPERNRLAMAMDDPRQHGRFAASFAVAASAIAAQSGCGALALAAPAGPFSMTTGEVKPEPNPLCHVASGLSLLAGKPLVVLKDAPPCVYGITVQNTGGLEGICTNASLDPVVLTFDQPVAAMCLEEHSAPVARSGSWRSLAQATTTQSLNLRPCEVVYFASKQIL